MQVSEIARVSVLVGAGVVVEQRDESLLCVQGEGGVGDEFEEGCVRAIRCRGGAVSDAREDVGVNGAVEDEMCE